MCTVTFIARRRGYCLGMNRDEKLTRPTAAALDGLPLNRINPFRLIGIYPATSEIIEWRWNLKNLVRKNHRWKAQQWISSGFDEPTAQRIRGRAFAIAQHQRSAGSLDWLRRLHRSHSPETGPFSICMHREEAATVCYTEVAVSAQSVVMRYHSGAPCRNTFCLSSISH